MQMGPGLDTGDMISKVTVEIGDMNFEQLHDKLAEAGRRFDSPLHVRVKVKEEGQPEREEERDVNPDMKALIPSGSDGSND